MGVQRCERVQCHEAAVVGQLPRRPDTEVERPAAVFLLPVLQSVEVGLDLIVGEEGAAALSWDGSVLGREGGPDLRLCNPRRAHNRRRRRDPRQSGRRDAVTGDICGCLRLRTCLTPAGTSAGRRHYPSSARAPPSRSGARVGCATGRWTRRLSSSTPLTFGFATHPPTKRGAGRPLTEGERRKRVDPRKG